MNGSSQMDNDAYSNQMSAHDENRQPSQDRSGDDGRNDMQADAGANEVPSDHVADHAIADVSGASNVDHGAANEELSLIHI